VGLVVAEFRHPAHPAAAQRGHINRCRQSDQSLVGADVGSGLLPADVLFPRGQGEDEGPFPLGVHRLPDQASGHAADVLHTGGEEAQVRAAEVEPGPHALPLADDDVGAEGPGRLQHPQSDGVRHHHQQRAGAVCGLRVRGQVLNPAQEVRVLDDEARGLLIQQVGHRSGDVPAVAHDVQSHALGVGADNGPVFGVDPGGEDDFLALQAVDVDGGDDGLGGGGGAVVVGRVGDLHAGQFADHRLVLKDGLEGPLADFRLVGGIGGVEFPAAQDGVHHGGDVVAVGTGAQEAGAVGGGEVGRRQGFQLPAGLHFR